MASLESADTLDDLVAVLREVRVQAGLPSYSQIATEVARVRAARRGIETAAKPGRVTVYDAFRDGRRRLDPDLASDILTVLGRPDLAPALHQAHARVLRHRAAATARPTVTVTPPGPSALTGSRAAEVADLTARVVAARPDDPPGDPVAEARTPSVVVLTGLPGVGKSTMARDLAHLLAARTGADAVLEIGLRTASGEAGPDTVKPREVAGEIRRARRARATGGSQGRARGVSHAVVLLDDVPSGGDLAEIAGLLDPADVLVATSRIRLQWDGATAHHVVEPMNEADSIALLSVLLAQHTRRQDPESDSEALRALAAHCGGLPLAMTILAGNAHSTPGWYLSDHVHRLDTLGLGTVPALQDALHHLTADQRRVLAFLARHRGRLTAQEIAVALAQGPAPLSSDEAARALTALRGANLVVQTHGRYDLHDVVRSGVRGTPEFEVRFSLLRSQTNALVSHLLAGYAASPSLSWIEEHAEAAVTTAQLAAELDLADAVGSLAQALSRQLLDDGRVTDAYLLTSAHLAALGDGEVATEHLIRHATAARLAGNLEDTRATLGRAVADAELLGPLRVALAETEAVTGSLERACDELEELLTESIPAEVRLSARYRLPQFLLVAGRAERARLIAEEVIAERANEPPDTALSMVRNNYARALCELDEAAAAEVAAHEAIAESRRSRTQRFEAQALSLVADAIAWQGRPDEATPFSDAAFELTQSLGDPAGVVILGANLVHSAVALGDLPRAREVLRAVRDARRRLNYAALELDELLARADVARAEGDAALSIAVLERAAAIADHQGLRLHEARTRILHGDALATLGDREGAVRQWRAVVQSPTSAPLRVRLARERLAQE
ncbi:ATP-binding protein [Serinibacter salmoneus]|uniref:AAA+ ATPase domain-containing protein n=1 Tax=Serinibacter salmoneus TaxID=556530 RepID=A0A2A9CVV3_9MICO|nr:ATP-binding protein [Serinibacter salmoneus]PFG18548.1 hypothetical protein ATL40_0088 [Serinibacter salmoneus]